MREKMLKISQFSEWCLQRLKVMNHTGGIHSMHVEKDRVGIKVHLGLDIYIVFNIF